MKVYVVRGFEASYGTIEREKGREREESEERDGVEVVFGGIGAICSDGDGGML